MQLIVRAPAWRGQAGIVACSSTRLGGASRGVLGCANFALRNAEPAQQTAANRAALAEKLGCESVQYLQQVHGNTCLSIDSCQFPAPKADAIYTRQPGIGLAVLTADCLPVFLAASGEVAVAHLGWRSLAAGLLARSLPFFHAAKADIVAGFGPAICADCFEVGPEVRDLFLQARMAASEHFRASPRSGHYYADLVAIARWQLLDLGLSAANIGARGDCTYCKQHLYYSHRRNSSLGRIANIIAIVAV